MLSILVLSAVGYGLIFLAYDLVPPFVAQILFGMKNEFPATFLMMMWFPFFIGVHSLLSRLHFHIQKNRYFQKAAVTVSESVVLDTKHFLIILDTVRPYIPDPAALGPRVVQQVILKYRASKSVEQASTMLSSLLELAREKVDNQYAGLRYIAWLLPTLGFMGTVYGISLTVSAVGAASPNDPNLLPTIATNLGIAFNTTLLALIQCAVLIYFSGLFQAKEETAITHLGEYILEHIINRLE